MLTSSSISTNKEALLVHKAIFGTIAAPDDLCRQYLAALAEYSCEEKESAALNSMMLDDCDLEAIELVLRRKDPYNFLTKRFKAMCYLAEARPEYLSFFVNDQPKRIAAGVVLCWQLFRTVWKFLRGCYLVRKYHVA